MGVIRLNHMLLTSIVGKVGDSLFRRLDSSTVASIDLYSARPDPPSPLKDPSAFNTPQLELRICDDLWKEANDPWREKWRAAVKAPMMIGYSLWMKEALSCAYAGTFLPDEPSPSGGFCNREVMPGDSLPNPKTNCPYVKAPWWPDPKPPADWWIDDTIHGHGDLVNSGYHIYSGMQKSTLGLRHLAKYTSGSAYIYANTPHGNQLFWIELSARGPYRAPDKNNTLTMTSGSTSVTASSFDSLLSITSSSGVTSSGASGTIMIDVTAGSQKQSYNDMNCMTWEIHGWKF